VNKKLLIICWFTAGVLIIFILGCLAGIYLEKQKMVPELEKITKAAKILNAINSKVIPSPIAFGEITKISGRIVTLNYAGESLDISVKDNAQIYSFSQGQKQIDFSQIKVGDWLNITIEVLPDGQVQGLSVAVVYSS